MEVEIKYAGRYGAKGERREKKKKPTREQIQKQNQWNRAKKVRRIIKANFKKGDPWVTLKYRAGAKPIISNVKKDITRFINSMRQKYKRRGSELKFIYRLEVGPKGGIHIHFLINRLEGYETDLLIQESWNPKADGTGGVWFTPLRETGWYKELAEYIVKQKEEAMEQLSMFNDEERQQLTKYSCSRNLIRPEPERKEYRRRTVRRIVDEGPKARKGYYIDKESVMIGRNPFTGFSYIHYTEIKIDERGNP